MTLAQIRQVDDNGHHYEAILFVCPGCGDDLHMLPVGGDVPDGKPRWDFDGNLDAPTLSPSILTRYKTKGEEWVCHSFLRAGVFEYLSDSTHQYAGQQVPMHPLPEWAVD
jgi:hypothetical protein